ncbi:hypothetical protein GMLC_02350 [Geomonas limicola]|uniref:Response regulatory domain-containing protein n=1 Tax=Geomonas limicola TaxID=2740186 RepID=A0A6V8N2E4_9BACT|nr:response regulator [Geomonas limicola]GFO66656.1 hypothetical protein GMLC_02350 [Geomonas limicola]
MKLLMVEDDAESLELSCRLISHEFAYLTVLQAADGVIGLEVFREHLPDIVISDITMPGMDGIALAAEIKALQPETKIILLTAHSDKRRLSLSMELGINDYILKPIDFKALVTAIRACLDEIGHEVRRGQR